MDKSQTIITKSPEETQKFGETVAASLMAKERRGQNNFSYHIICLYGDLGAGKTVFVQGLAKKLGITPRLLSPTFIIVRRYDIPKFTSYLYHMDLYRILKEQDAQSLGLCEFFADTKSLTVVEWAERIESLLPKKRVDIHFSVVDETQRRIDITYVG
jgi:tRNA threonylcarbamoyladenosine biosynthesis protein TsaE